MTTKVAFLYCTGTAYTFSAFNNAIQGVSVASGASFWGNGTTINPGKAPVSTYASGLNGQVYPWDGEVFNDPFPFMLDPNVWEPQRVAYADASLTFLVGGRLLGGMGTSINDGVSKVIARINALPPGQPFAIGGYSQGAAVMSTIYNELRTGSLTSRFPSFLGGVCFGNPRRQVNHRGEIGGSWSGAWDVPGSNTGGHGSFPATGPWARLSGCDPTKWIEFAAPDDIITSTGDSPTGTLWTRGNDALLNLIQSQYAFPAVIEFITGGVLGILPPVFRDVVESLVPEWNDFTDAINAAFTLAGRVNFFKDALNGIVAQPGAGHVIYPVLPPPNSDGSTPSIAEQITTVYTTAGSTVKNGSARSRAGQRPPSATQDVTVTQTYLSPVGDTCYQLALKWLENKAKTYATAPIVMPSTGAVGWSTSMIPPAS